MAKTLLFSIMIGDNPTYPYVAENLRYYAARIGSDVVLCTELDYAKEFEGIYGCYGLERLQIAQYLRGEYERVVCVDSDILIQPDAANIFDACPDTDAIYAFNEGVVQDRRAVVADTLQVMGDAALSWPHKGKKWQYYNVGVVVFSKAHLPFFDLVEKDAMLTMSAKVDMFEQCYFNYLWVKHGIKTADLNFKFNRMDMLGGHFRKLNSHFIHYAGAGFTGRYGRREAMIMDDLKSLFPETCALIGNSETRTTRHKWRRFLYGIKFPFSVPCVNYF
ncbi:MAG: hypothetical protein O3A01_08810 [bacterium]|nr:hypothetical protein [bacterium]